MLANAAHIRNVPGRKSDVNDAVWISDLLAHGLIRASFVPPAPVQDLRDLTRTRTQLAREVTQHVQRLQKILEDANIKLVTVISDIMGVSGRRILKAMMAGETNAAKLAKIELIDEEIDHPHRIVFGDIVFQLSRKHRSLSAIRPAYKAGHAISLLLAEKILKQNQFSEKLDFSHSLAEADLMKIKRPTVLRQY